MSAVSAWPRKAATWFATAEGRGVAAALLLIAAGQLAFAAFERVQLRLPLVREAPPSLSGYQVAQTLFVGAASVLLVLMLHRARARPGLIDRERVGRSGLAAVAPVAAGAAATALFVFDPRLFHFWAREDRAFEWMSALLLLAAAAGIAAAGRRLGRDRTAAAASGLLAIILIVIAGEEISWGQRLIGFATPERLSEVNWQSEFNLHNLQTDLSETLYYFGAGLFLVIVPLLRDMLPASWAGNGLVALAPDRSVALAAGPVIWFDYGHWNLFPIQLATLASITAYLYWAAAAARRGRVGERTGFLLAAAASVLGQLVFLACGSQMIDVPDATEYKEFFIALGFAFYAWSLRGSRLSGEGFA